MKAKRSLGPAFAAALLGAGAVAGAFFFKPLPALEDQSLLRSDSSVRVEAVKAGLVFSPTAAAKASGLVFYGDARVPPEAYAYLARACAAAGYETVLSAMPLNFATLSPSQAALAAAACPGVSRWVLAGHALGGSAAALFAARSDGSADQMSVAGLLLIAAFPGRSADLSTKTFHVVTLSGSRDALTTTADIAGARDRLPSGSRYVEIAGGNHAQFGEYGPQTGDGPAEIPGPTQRKATVEEALGLLDLVETGVGK